MSKPIFCGKNLKTISASGIRIEGVVKMNLKGIPASEEGLGSFFDETVSPFDSENGSFSNEILSALTDLDSLFQNESVKELQFPIVNANGKRVGSYELIVSREGN